MNKLLFVTIIASILAFGFAGEDVFNVDPTKADTGCSGDATPWTCKTIADALKKFAALADTNTAKLVLKGNVVLDADITAYSAQGAATATTSIAAKVTTITSDSGQQYSIDFATFSAYVGAGALTVDNVKFIRATGTPASGSRNDAAFFVHKDATAALTVNKCTISETTAQDYVIYQTALATTATFSSCSFNVKARAAGNIQQNIVPTNDAANTVNILGGTYVIIQGTNPTDTFIKATAASSSGVAKVTKFDVDTANSNQEVSFTQAASTSVANGGIYTNDGLAAHTLVINSLIVQNYRVASALIYSPAKSLITVTSCKFDSNTNTVTDATSENGVGLAFKLIDSFAEFAPADSKKIEFSNNIANVGPALAVLVKAAADTPAAAGSWVAPPTNIIGTASFTNNAARFEGASIYVYLAASSATNHWTKLLALDATSKKVSWPTAWSFSGNKAYVGKDGSLTSATPYNGGAQFGIFFYFADYKTSSFRYYAPTYTNGPSPSLAFNNGLPYIKDVLPGQNIADKLTFTYGDINGNPFWESGVTQWRPSAVSVAPTQVILKATAEASSTKVAYDLLSTDAKDKNWIASGDPANVTTPFTVAAANSDLPTDIMALVEAADWFKTTFKKAPTANCPTHKGVITKQVVSSTSTSNELTLSKGPQLDTADSTWFFIVKQDIVSANATFVRSNQNPVIPDATNTGTKVLLALPVQFRDLGCLNQCKLNEWVESTSTCKPCDAACKQCSGGTSSDCLVCANGQAPISGKCGCSDATQVLSTDGSCVAPADALIAVKALTWTQATLDALSTWQSQASYAANLFTKTTDAGLLPTPDKPCGNSCSGAAKGTCMTNMTLVPYCKCVTDGTGALCQYAAADLTAYMKVGGDATKALNTIFGTLDKTKTVDNVKQGGLAIQTLLAAPDTLDETSLGYLVTIMQKIVDTPTLIDSSNRPALGAAQQRLFQAVVSRNFASNDTKKDNLNKIQAQQLALVNSQFADQFAILTANKGQPSYMMGDSVSSVLQALDTTVETATLTLGDTKVVFPKEFMTQFKTETNPVIVRIQSYSNNIYAAASTTTALNSSVISIDVMSGADAATASSDAGKKVVANLASPITITLPITNGAKNLTCAFWNTTTNAWDTTGVNTNASTATTQNCETTHLTSFGGVVGSVSSSNTSSGNGTTNGSNTTGTFAPNLNLGYVYVYILAILGFIAALV